ncbi:MAG: hypothetical protein HOK21_01070 [Rhodospirillaceae bacterium]|jgi:flagellar hook-length control protein FliK|nr:hypothetical protein [Rhodospirillaceae bacterium]MBT5082349.1 hypothetical protein [Rhodospirillaceae bacterium]MBT5522650.1 hypothetical protein [Rhodospirillaceae bacterium]MBT5881246.1 hypothetical protein [Rhodospirillaceae bacterium]MBT7284498.1 hypothetical protein [Rhodospirillaceae bacterium]
MNFNIANLGSLPNDYMGPPSQQLDISRLCSVDEDGFAHILRNEGKRDEQASFEAKDRDASEAREGIEQSDNRDSEADRRINAKQEEQDSRDEKNRERDGEDSDNQSNSEDGRDDTTEDTDLRAAQGDGHESGLQADPLQFIRDQQAAAQEAAGPAAQPGNSQADANPHRQDAPGQQTVAVDDITDVTNGINGVGNANGEQTADAARMAAAAAMNQNKAAEVLTNLVSQGRPNGAAGLQPGLPGLPGNADPLANGTLPEPLMGKLNAGNIPGEATADAAKDKSLKYAQQIQLQAAQPNTPNLRGGRPQHGGGFMADTLPRPQTAQSPLANAFGRPLAENMPPQQPGQQGLAAQPVGGPAANAANIAGSNGPDSQSGVQNLQLSVSPAQTGKADLPTLSTRSEMAAASAGTTAVNAPVQTSAIPQTQANLAMDGEVPAKLPPMAEDTVKATNSNSNSATATSTASANGTTDTKGAATVQQSVTSDVRSPAIQVSMQLSKALQNGLDKMTIRLDPVELGRVDVKLEIGHDGRVLALVAADRPETLDLLKQDSRSLEKALQDAGLETDENSLDFSLGHGGEQGGALADNGKDDENGKGNRNASGNGASENDGVEVTGDDEVLPQVTSNRALDISV